MTTTLSFQIRVIKNQIQACLREIQRGVKQFVDRLIVLEDKLEKLEAQIVKKVKLSEKATLIKSRLVEGLTNWNRDENDKLVAETLQVVDLCNDSLYWEKWGRELLLRNWKNDGFSFLSKKIRQYANIRLRAKDPVILIEIDLADNGFSVKNWENYGKRRLYVYGESGEGLGYIDIRKDTIVSFSDNDIVDAIVANRVKAWLN